MLPAYLAILRGGSVSCAAASATSAVLYARSATSLSCCALDSSSDWERSSLASAWCQQQQQQQQQRCQMVLSAGGCSSRASCQQCTRLQGTSYGKRLFTRILYLPSKQQATHANARPTHSPAIVNPGLLGLTGSSRARCLQRNTAAANVSHTSCAAAQPVRLQSLLCITRRVSGCHRRRASAVAFRLKATALALCNAASAGFVTNEQRHALAPHA
jgi:hypothetical protein